MYLGVEAAQGRHTVRCEAVAAAYGGDAGGGGGDAVGIFDEVVGIEEGDFDAGLVMGGEVFAELEVGGQAADAAAEDGDVHFGGRMAGSCLGESVGSYWPARGRC